MELAQADTFSEAEYQTALDAGPQLAGAQGIDARSLRTSRRDDRTDEHAGVADRSDQRRCVPVRQLGVRGGRRLSAREVTGGFAFGLPVGVTFMASAWSEPTLDQDRFRFRSSGGRSSPAAVPAHLQGWSGRQSQAAAIGGKIGLTSPRSATRATRPLPRAAIAQADVLVTSAE